MRYLQGITDFLYIPRYNSWGNLGNNLGAATSINGLCESLRKNGMTITKPSVPRYFLTMRMERGKTLHSERQRN